MATPGLINNLYPLQYAYGLNLSFDALNPGAYLYISAGSTFDSTQQYQIVVPQTITIQAAISGENGIDTPSYTANTAYQIFIISKKSGEVAGLLSLSDTPNLPFGYTYYKSIGYVFFTDSRTFVPGSWTQTNFWERKFVYDTPPLIYGGSATTRSSVYFNTVIPKLAQGKIYLANYLTVPANTGFSIYPLNYTYCGTGDITQASPWYYNNIVPISFFNNNVGVEYFVSNGSAILYFYVCAYDYTIR